MRGRARIALAGSVVLVVGLAAAIAMADNSGGGAVYSGTTGTESTPTPAADVPPGPEVNFCPTPEQTDEHLRLYGFDYKPTVDCSRAGETAAQGQSSQDDDDLSNSQRCQYHKELLRSAKPLPDVDGDPTTMQGVLPDGREVIVSVMTDNPQLYNGQTIQDQAKDYSC